jgi:hypothetical protein
MKPQGLAPHVGGMIVTPGSVTVFVSCLLHHMATIVSD